MGVEQVTVDLDPIRSVERDIVKGAIHSAVCASVGGYFWEIIEQIYVGCMQFFDDQQQIFYDLTVLEYGVLICFVSQHYVNRDRLLQRNMVEMPLPESVNLLRGLWFYRHALHQHLKRGCSC